MLGAFGSRSGAIEQSSAAVDDLLADYAARCVTLRRRVRVETNDSRIVGVATGVGADGSLVVDTDAGNLEVRVGDVVHLRADD